MERDSVLYKTRRKCQTIAHRIFSDEMMSKFYYKVVLGEKLNLKNPQTFNEKLQWLKLNYWPNNKLAIQCADKYAVRDYIKTKGYGETLTPLIGNWTNADDIDFGKLPKQFVLKCNHGCAYNIVVSDKDKINTDDVKRQLSAWLKEDFGAFNIELHYSKIKPHRIVCEEFLGEKLIDYKFFCFNGEPKFIYVSTDLVHDRQAQLGFFNLDGTKIPLKRDDYADIPEIQFPDYFNEMLSMARDLGADFPFVRADFFLANDRYYFAELTFTPGACMMPFNPKKYDSEWGKLLDISKVEK